MVILNRHYLLLRFEAHTIPCRTKQRESLLHQDRYVDEHGVNNGRVQQNIPPHRIVLPLVAYCSKGRLGFLAPVVHVL